MNVNSPLIAIAFCIVVFLSSCGKNTCYDCELDCFYFGGYSNPVCAIDYESINKYNDVFDSISLVSQIDSLSKMEVTACGKKELDQVLEINYKCYE